MKRVSLHGSISRAAVHHLRARGGWAAPASQGPPTLRSDDASAGGSRAEEEGDRRVAGDMEVQGPVVAPCSSEPARDAEQPDADELPWSFPTTRAHGRPLSAAAILLGRSQVPAGCRPPRCLDTALAPSPTSPAGSRRHPVGSQPGARWQPPSPQPSYGSRATPASPDAKIGRAHV